MDTVIIALYAPSIYSILIARILSLRNPKSLYIPKTPAATTIKYITIAIINPHAA